MRRTFYKTLEPAKLSKDVNIYKTIDLILAAYLKSKGMRLSGWTKSPSNQVTFEFVDENNEVKNLLVEYLNSSEKRFYDEVKSLKRLT